MKLHGDNLNLFLKRNIFFQSFGRNICVYYNEYCIVFQISRIHVIASVNVSKLHNVRLHSRTVTIHRCFGLNVAHPSTIIVLLLLQLARIIVSA